MTDETSTQEQVANSVPPSQQTETQQADASVNENAEVVTPVNADSGSASQDAPAEGEGKSRARERIEELVAERKAAMEYAEFWRTKAMEVIQPPKQQTPPQPELKEVPAPTLDQFKGDTSKWSEAMTAWTDNQIAFRTQKALEAKDQEQITRETLTKFELNIEKFKETHPDFDIIVSNPKLPVLDHQASRMIVASDYSADLTYALGQDPAMATKISRMRPEQQALAIGRLEAQIVANNNKLQVNVNPTPSLKNPSVKQPSAPKQTTTEAPPPLTPVSGNGVVEQSPENTDVREWMRLRNKEARNGRRRF